MGGGGAPLNHNCRWFIFGEVLEIRRSFAYEEEEEKQIYKSFAYHTTKTFTLTSAHWVSGEAVLGKEGLK